MISCWLIQNDGDNHNHFLLSSLERNRTKDRVMMNVMMMGEG